MEAVGPRPQHLLQSGFYAIDVFRPVHLHVDDGDHAAGRIQLLHHRKLREHAREHSGFDDAADVPGMPQGERAADVQVLGAGEILVHQDVVGTLKRAAFHVVESAAHGVELLQINARQSVQIGNFFEQRSIRHRHMRDLAHHVHVFFADVFGEGKSRAVGRADHDVRAGSLGAFLHFSQGAHAQAHQREDQGDLDANENGAEEGSNRPVFEVFQNQSIDQIVSVATSPKISRRGGSVVVEMALRQRL